MKKTATLFFLVFTICSTIVSGQDITIKTYTVNDGLVANPVRRIYQDSKGFIWIVTWEGISKYDGYKFTNYNMTNGLSHELVNDIWEIKDKMYVAQNNGVVDVIRHGEVVSPKPVAEKIIINKFHLVKGQKLLVATDSNGICEFNNNHFLKKPQPRPNSTYDELIEIDDSLLLSLESGLGILRIHTRNYKLLAEQKINTAFLCAYIDADKRIWIGTTKGIKLLTPVTNSHPTFAFISLPNQFAIPFLQNSFITKMQKTSNGDFWIGTTQGLLRYEPDGSSYLFTKKDGLPSESVTDIFEDKEKNIWIGTSLGLAKIVTANRISIYSTKNGMISDIVADMALLNHNELMLLTKNGIQKFNFSSQRFTNIPGADKPWPYYYIQKDDPFLIYTKDMISEYDSTRQLIVRKKIPPLYSYYLVTDTHGNFFSGSENGLLAYSGTTGHIENWLPFRISSLLLEEPGYLWAGTWVNGLYRIKYEAVNGKLEFVVKEFTDLIKVKDIRSLFRDSKGNIWIGTRYDGAFRLSKKNNDQYEAIHIAPAQGLNSDWVWSFAEGKDGNIWVGTRAGLDKLIFKENGVRVFNFSRTNNFFGQTTAIIPSGDNKIWCLTDGRLVEFSDEQLETHLPLPVYITSVVLSDRRQNKNRLKTDTTISLKHYQNQLHFEFSAPGFINEKQILYSYRLSGGNDTLWSDPSNSHDVSYASLKPGDYRFEVRTLGWNEQWGKAAYFSFFIRPPFWQTWWFIGICIVFLGALLYAFYRYRINQLKKMQKVRNLIATDLHDDIGSTLTNINILTQLGNKNLQQPQEVSKYLDRIAEEVNTSGQALDDIIWSVNTKNDTLDEILVRMRRFAAELFDQSNVQCKLELKETVTGKKMNMEQRRDLYLIYKESLNNIYKHANAQRVYVELRMNKNTLTLKISDDGRGFNPQLDTERNGLKNLKARAEKWKGEIVITSQSQGGSAVSVTMPVKD